MHDQSTSLAPSSQPDEIADAVHDVGGAPDRTPSMSWVVGPLAGLLIGLAVGYLAFSGDTTSGDTTAVTTTLFGAFDADSVTTTAAGSVTAADALVSDGIALAQQGDTAGAAAQYQAALRIEPDNRFALYNLGLLSQLAGDLAAAENYYEEALASDATFAGARYNLALVLEASGDTAGATRELRTIIQADPNSVSALYHLGNTLIAQGATEEGAALVERAVALDPSLLTITDPSGVDGATSTT